MLFLAAGCATSVPVQTATRAVTAARKGQLTQFQRLLTTKAQSTIGTEQAMQAIRQTLARYTNPSIGPALLVSSKQGDQGYGHVGDVRRIYETTLTASPRRGAPPQPLYTLRVKCRISYEPVHHDEVPDSCTTTIDDNGIPWTTCSGASPAYDSIDYQESCWVAGIEPQPTR